MTTEGRDVAYNTEVYAPARAHTFVIEIDRPGARGTVCSIPVEVHLSPLYTHHIDACSRGLK